MQDLVEQVLRDRRRRSAPRGFGIALGWALALHGTVLAVFMLAGRPQASKPFEFVPVQVMPLQALGSPKPPAAAKPRASERAPLKPAEPPPKPEPTPAKTAPVVPSPAQKPPSTTSRPAPQAPQVAKPQPSPEPDAPSEAGSTRQGSAQGHEAGTAALGSARIEGVDPDFTYDYYLDRMLALISAQWTRPSTQGDIKATLRFTVQKTGEISELELAESSGFNAFDLSAMRAVQNASPLPRLPASYKRGMLRVTLIVR